MHDVGDKHAACSLATQLIETIEATFIRRRKVPINIGVTELLKGADLSHVYLRTDNRSTWLRKNGKKHYKLACG